MTILTITAETLAVDALEFRMDFKNDCGGHGGDEEGDVKDNAVRADFYQKAKGIGARQRIICSGAKGGVEPAGPSRHAASNRESLGL